MIGDSCGVPVSARNRNRVIPIHQTAIEFAVAPVERFYFS
jgi:hypothetical protein